MTTPPTNPDPLSAGLDEADLLAVVEGTPLPAERAARVREALAADPRLAELAAMMRADREVIASLPPVSAPADLLDRVEVLLEREALVGLARSEAFAQTGDLPVSRVIPIRRPWLTLRTGGSLAAAAAVLLIAGGVLMLVPGKTLKPGPLANAGGPTPDSTDIAINNAGTGNTAAASDSIIAAKPPVDSPPTDVHRAPPVNTPVIAKATAAAPLSAEQLLAAAREGRLVLRLRAADDHAVIGRVEALRGNPRGIAIEQMSGAAYAVASNHFSRDWSSRLPLDLIRPPVERPPLPAVADGTPTPPHPPAPFAPPLPAHEPRANEPQPILSQQAFIASIPATADGLEGLLKLRTDVVRGEWTILADPMTLDAPADAQSILWWATPASGWAPRLTVPIVVQSN